MARTWSTFNAPPQWGKIQGIPSDFSDGKIDWGEVSNKPNFNFLNYNSNHVDFSPDHTDLTANNLSMGISSGDYKFIDNNFRGWHILTLGNFRAGENFRVQLAMCDTDDILLYRRQSFSIWFPWRLIL